MKKLFTMLLLLLSVVTLQAQMQEPVKFKAELKNVKGAEAEIVFTGKIDAGWHVYSTGLPSGGPISATFTVDKSSGVELVGKLTPRGHEISKHDEMFDMKLRYFEGSVQFVQKVKFTKPSYSINCHLEFGACNDQNCMPPTQVEFKHSGKAAATAAADPKAEAALNAAASGDSLTAPASADSLSKTAQVVHADSATTANLW